MLVLAIDTAGPDCSVALARGVDADAEIGARACERIGRGHAERLMPMIETALANAGVDFADLDRIAVTVGPGSFTGVRVGIAAARGLALALDISAVGVNSLEALIVPVARRKSAGSAIATLDAKRGEIYVLARDLGAGDAILEATALRLEDITHELQLAPRPLFITGSGASIVADALGGRDVIITGMAESPEIADVARLGLAADEGSPPLPLYLRGPDAKAQAGQALARI